MRRIDRHQQARSCCNGRRNRHKAVHNAPAGLTPTKNFVPDDVSGLMMGVMNIWTEPVEGFIRALRNAGLRRGLIAADRATDKLTLSHPLLEPLADAMRADPNFDAHAASAFEIGEESDHLLAAFVHRTERGQAAGGVRFWSYPELGNLVRDGLRLSRAMGQKNALAGLWWGGGKGIIARRDGVDYQHAATRAAIFRDYGRFISSLAGCYVTAEDVGTRPADMAAIFSTTRHATSIPAEFGGSGNPSVLTARGVVVAMEAALQYTGAGPVAGKTVAIQGIGNVAVHMAEELLARDVGRIIACDIDAGAVKAAIERLDDQRAEISVCEPGDLSILATRCDVLAPSAVGGIINPQTIPAIQAPLVCGAANNQLEDLSRDSLALQQRNIVYIPDFLANRMGIVNCANEQYGVFPGDPAVAAHLDPKNPESVQRRLVEVLDRAAASGRPPAVEATLLADELAGQAHPIWGHRAQDIIDYLSGHWAGA